MRFTLKAFDQLNTTELFEIYKLRSEVFVVEQNCAYQDVDDKDPKAYHLLLYENDRLAGYCRILPPGISYKEPAIGRVVVHINERGKNFGRLLMLEAIKEVKILFDNNSIMVSAQTYLKKFYHDLGFLATGKEYLEDDIPHMEMTYTIVKT